MEGFKGRAALERVIGSTSAAVTVDGGVVQPPAPHGVGRDPLAEDPSWWRPTDEPRPLVPKGAHAFYIHPTTYLFPDRWNAPLQDRQSGERAALFVQSQASAFGDVEEIHPSAAATAGADFRGVAPCHGQVSTYS